MANESHPEPAFTYLAIGNVYKYMKLADDAEQFYLKGFGILSDVLGKDHFETEYARNRLVSLFEETGQDDKIDALMQN
jgi:hypothetical protein